MVTVELTTSSASSAGPWNWWPWNLDPSIFRDAFVLIAWCLTRQDGKTSLISSLRQLRAILHSLPNSLGCSFSLGGQKTCALQLQLFIHGRWPIHVPLNSSNKRAFAQDCSLPFLCSNETPWASRSATTAVGIYVRLPKIRWPEPSLRRLAIVYSILYFIECELAGANHATVGDQLPTSFHQSMNSTDWAGSLVVQS